MSEGPGPADVDKEKVTVMTPTLRVRRTTTLIGLGLAIALVASTGCKEETPAPAAKATKPPPPIRLGVLLPDLEHPFFARMRDAVQAQAKQRRVGETLVRDARTDPKQQATQLTELAGAGVDALIIYPIDPKALAAVLQQPKVASVPLVAVGQAVRSRNLVTTITVNNNQAGQLLCQAIGQALGGQGAILVLEARRDAPFNRDRLGGVMQCILTQQQKLTFLDERVVGIDPESVDRVVSEWIKKFQPNDVGGLLALADELALPAIKTFHQAGWDRLKVVSFVGKREAFEAVRAGTLHATIVHDPAELAREAVDAAVDRLVGKRVDAKITCGVKLVTAANVDQHQPGY